MWNMRKMRSPSQRCVMGRSRRESTTTLLVLYEVMVVRMRGNRGTTGGHMRRQSASCGTVLSWPWVVTRGLPRAHCWRFSRLTIRRGMEPPTDTLPRAGMHQGRSTQDTFRDSWLQLFDDMNKKNKQVSLLFCWCLPELVTSCDTNEPGTTLNLI